jgi:hypothetical protein
VTRVRELKLAEGEGFETLEALARLTAFETALFDSDGTSVGRTA